MGVREFPHCAKQNSVKATLLLIKLLMNWFHGKWFRSERDFFVFPHSGASIVIVWKFGNFLATQILREVNFYGIVQHFWNLVMVNFRILSKLEFNKSQNPEAWNCQNASFWDSTFCWNWFHVNICGRKNPKFLHCGVDRFHVKIWETKLVITSYVQCYFSLFCRFHVIFPK